MTIPPKAHSLEFTDPVGLSDEGALFVGATVALSAAISAVGVVQEGNDTVAMVGTVTTAALESTAQQAISLTLHAIAYADAIDRCLWWIIHTLEQPITPETIVYACSLLIAVAGVIYVHSRKG